MDRREAARVQLSHDMRQPWTTLQAGQEGPITALDIATEDGPSDFAMLWLRGGKLRKSLTQMKEHAPLNEWLGGALPPASVVCSAENFAMKATCSHLQLSCRHQAATAGPLLACRFQIHERGGDTHRICLGVPEYITLGVPEYITLPC